MTSHTTGIQWVSKPLNHSRAHVFHQPTRRVPPFSAPANHPSSSDGEPAQKKQKLLHEPDAASSPFASPIQYKGTQTPQVQRPASSTVHDSSSSNPAVGQSSSTRPISSTATSLVFPLRPSSDQNQARRNRHNAVSQTSALGLGAVQTKPFVLEQPSLAPRYPSGSRSSTLKESIVSDPTKVSAGEDAADFSPWSGIHAEDVLGESNIKQGFYDKMQVSQNESSTAKPTAWNSLKHKSGLHVLSSLFVSVLEQRQSHGTVTAGCTFKPPPRVTLTDSKREAWLRDLANPTVPLRRLSRTIPHGIRGRALLDHSLAKKIPTARSLWLAKCVGANEIRAFKRKGASGAFAVGGEAKWIKDWTSNVEQFLDALISTCGCDGWRENMAYGLRIAAHLFAESLLDRDHYFDWLLNAVSQADLDTVPLYLLIVKSHLTELGQSRRCGRRLAECLLDQLHAIEQHASPDVCVEARIEVVDLTKAFIVASPASFLLPRRWSKYQSILHSVVGTSHSALYQDLRKRNMRLQALAGSDAGSEVTISQTLLQIYDSMAPGLDLANVARTTWEIPPDPAVLVRTSLCWSSSIYKTGCARIYTAARLLRSWSELGINIETAILNFLAVDSKGADLDKASLYRVIAELIRSRHFAVGTYLNWVIANGSLRRCGNSTKDVSPDVGLLLELPLHGLSAHILNLRLNLLRSIGVRTDEEAGTVAQRKAAIDRRLQHQHEGPVALSDLNPRPLCLDQDTLAVKLDIAHWIGQKLLTYSVPGGAALGHLQEKIHTGNVGLSHPLPTLPYLPLVEILEDLGDFTTLVDVLLYLSRSRDPRVLTTAAITVSHYRDIFLAIGAANPIFERIMLQNPELKDKPGYPALMEALADLAEGLPNQVRNARVLRKELQKQGSKLSVAACSPISEHMTEALQTEHSRSSPPCTDDIEQLLTSGTSMDKRLVTNVYESIWKRFEMTWVSSVQSSFVAAGLIARLRSFDETAVNEMTAHRIDEVLALESRPQLRSICIPLICARVITFETLLSRVARLLHQVKSSSIYDALLVDAVECLTIGRQKVESSISHLYYRFHTEQQQALHKFPPSMVSLLQHVLKSAHNPHQAPPTSLYKLLRDERFLGVLRTASGSGPQGWKSIREIFDPILMWEGAVQTLGCLVLPSIDEQKRIGNHGRLSVLLNNVAVLGLPLCRLYLEAILMDASKAGNDAAAQELLHVSTKMLAASSTTDVELWASIISNLPQQLRKAIGDRAEMEFFALLASTPKPRTEEFRKQLDYYLSMVTAADNGMHDSGSATCLLTQAYETIAHLPSSPLLSRLKNKLGRGPEVPKMDVAEDAVNCEILHALLRLLNTHHSAFCTPNVSEDAVTQLLVLLSLLHVGPFPVTYAHLSRDICDFLTIISDCISPAVQARCIRLLQNQHHLKHSRLDYIFTSSSATDDTWLQLSTGTTNSTGKSAPQHFAVRRWETMQDATPLMTENDTSISLSLFGARKAVL